MSRAEQSRAELIVLLFIKYYNVNKVNNKIYFYNIKIIIDFTLPLQNFIEEVA